MGGLQITVVGWSDYDFTADNGQHLQGRKYHIIRPFQRPNCKGQEACTISISDFVLKDNGPLEIGRCYDVMYDQKGRIFRYSPAKVRQA